MRFGFMTAGIAALLLTTGCGDLQSTSQTAEGAQPREARARFEAAELLDLIAAAQANRPIELPSDVRPQQVEAAFTALHARLKVNEQRPSQLDVDPEFARGLSERQKQGLSKLQMGFSQRVNENAIRITRGPDGRLRPEAADGRNEGQGQGHQRHAVSNGWWYWKTSYSWWGVTATLNHNYLYYLCAYTSWMLSAASIPGWIETVLSWLACAPHNFDSGGDGAKVYITWAGVFWYSA
jgi:hypothetical protein